MASGVQAADEVCCIFYDMKVWKCSTAEKNEEKKDDKKYIIVEEGKKILVGDVGLTITDPFKHFVGTFLEKDCPYALYDASFETKESRKEELIKMIYASLKDAIKKKFQSIKCTFLEQFTNCI
uniref:ADF-H domain-containing protein n=1 Tax=Nannospalax galili TaxID=1026970 RepID=A0A8C6RDV6_NANGA